MDTSMDHTHQEITGENQSVNFKSLQHIWTCSDDFFVDDKEFQQCLKGCKW